MSTFEMVCWAVIALLVIVFLGGIMMMTLSGKARCSESDALVAQADEEDYRAGSRF